MNVDDGGKVLSFVCSCVVVVASVAFGYSIGKDIAEKKRR